MFKKITAYIAAVIICTGSLTLSALPSPLNYQYDENNESIPAPETYTAAAVYYGTDFGIGALNSPSDIFVDKSNQIYIADTGNNRIVVLNQKFEHIRTIDRVSGNGLETFSNPMGVYAEDGMVYICDTGNARAISVNSGNEIVRYITGANMVSVNENFVFQPEKIILDKNNNILISSSAIYQGILRFDENNEFKNFFAPNQVEATFETFLLSLLKSFFTDEQKEGVAKQLPAPYSNICLGKDSFIYATSQNVAAGQDIKCLNSAGTNTLTFASANSGKTVYGDYQSAYKNTTFVDINCDINGNILVADRQTGRLFLYDQECNLMAIFGGLGDRDGQFSEISAIEKIGESYLVLDKIKGSITVFSPTEYMQKLLEAMEYYRRCEYIESEQIWQELLEANSNLPLAYCSLGRSKYHLGEYKLAMEYLEKGGDTYFYSLALNEYRKEFVQNHFVVLIVGGASALAIIIFIIRWIRKKLSE